MDVEIEIRVGFDDVGNPRAEVLTKGAPTPPAEVVVMAINLRRAELMRRLAVLTGFLMESERQGKGGIVAAKVMPMPMGPRGLVPK